MKRKITTPSQSMNKVWKRNGTPRALTPAAFLTKKIRQAVPEKLTPSNPYKLNLNQNFIPTPQTNLVLGTQSQIQSFNTIYNGTPKMIRNPNIFRTKELEEGELPSSDTENFYMENKAVPFKEADHW